MLNEIVGRGAGSDVTLCPGVENDSGAELCRGTAENLAALGELTEGIAHDFRNILAFIDAGLRLAERHQDCPGKVREFIAGARDGVDRGLALTAKLLAFGKQQNREIRLVDVNGLLHDLELFLRFGAGPQLRIVLELGSDIPKCAIDVAQFNAAILNLVVNARDAMPQGGEVVVSTCKLDVENGSAVRPCGSYVRVRVCDHGEGIPEAVLSRIFDPFFTTKGQKGTGLGLPQVLAFVKFVGGYIEVSSKPNEGATFDLLFPAIVPVEYAASSRAT